MAAHANSAALNGAANVMFLVSGADKAERLKQVLKDEPHPHDLPAQAIKPTEGRVLWMVDQEAGALL